MRRLGHGWILVKVSIVLSKDLRPDEQPGADVEVEEGVEDCEEENELKPGERSPCHALDRTILGLVVKEMSDLLGKGSVRRSASCSEAKLLGHLINE